MQFHILFHKGFVFTKCKYVIVTYISLPLFYKPLTTPEYNCLNVMLLIPKILHAVSLMLT